MERTKNIYTCDLECGYDNTPLDFEKYRYERWNGECYWLSTMAMLGLDDDAKLVRGKYTKEGGRPSSYRHGWVEFIFEKKKYVFDSLIKGVTPAKEYCKYYEPEIYYENSKKKILDVILSDEYCQKDGNPWIITKYNEQKFGTKNNAHVAIWPYSQFTMSTDGLKIEKVILNDNRMKC